MLPVHVVVSTTYVNALRRDGARRRLLAKVEAQIASLQVLASNPSPTQHDLLVYDRKLAALRAALDELKRYKP